MSFLEVLIDGLTLGGKVRVVGEAVSVPELENPLPKSEQVKLWGEPRYKVISEKEFLERGGEEAESMELPAPPATPETEPSGEFASLDGLNVEATLDEVAKFDDAKAARFIEFEKAGQVRKGVLGPLGAAE